MFNAEITGRSFWPLALATALVCAPAVHADGRMGGMTRGDWGARAPGFTGAPQRFNQFHTTPRGTMNVPRFSGRPFQRPVQMMPPPMRRPAPQQFRGVQPMPGFHGTPHFVDGHFGHHAPFPPGRIFHTLPPRHQVIFHHGDRFFFSHGVFFHAHGPHFAVVAPPVGLVVHAPFVPFTTFWFAGFPYPFFWASGVYYVQTPDGYVVTQPPPGDPVMEQAPDPNADANGGGITEQPADGQLSRAPADELYVYPSQGQSQQQLDADRQACREWAVGQVGYDPNNASTGFQVAEKRVDYDRALSACLEGRGYTVK